MKKILGIVLIAETVNGAYLYAFDSPSLFYLANVLFHLGLGIALLCGLFLLLTKQFLRLEPEARLATILLLVAAILGVVLMYTGTTRSHKPLLTAHILLACTGFALVLVHLIVRKQQWWWFALTSLIAVVFVMWVPEESSRISNPPEAALTMEEEGPGPSSPFFPSAANTSLDGVVPSSFFTEPESCARSGCHPEIYRQWSTSAHRFASFNNQWYRKSIEYMQEVVGTQPSKWCGGCHDHALLFSGMMDQPVKEQIDRPEAQAGLTCVSCHAISSVTGTTGNGGFVIEYPDLHDLATSDNPIVQALHDWIVRLDPGPHKSTFLKPFMREQPAEFCSTCHKTHLDVPVNDFRWIRGFNEYDGWQSGAASGQGAQAFYDLDLSRDCVDCHMPLLESKDAGNIAGVVHDHRFPGANTALPYVNGHQEQLQLVSDFLENDQLEVDLFAVQIPGPDDRSLTTEEAGSGLFGEGAAYTIASQVVGPLDRIQPVVQKGDSIRVDVLVHSKGIGHFFPGGTADAFDVWVELKAVDDRGKVIFWSGQAPTLKSGKRGPVDPGAHFYRSVFMDGHGNLIDKRNVWAARSAVYSRSIPPGAADLVHYRVFIPEDAGERIFLSVRVNHRKFSWLNTQFAYAGIRDPEMPDPDFTSHYDDGRWIFSGDTSDVSGKLKEIPDLPITIMASARAEIGIANGPKPEQSALYLREDENRWNNYGIALLLQRDYEAAEEVFRRITEIAPEFREGWINLGRSTLLQGRPEEAQAALLRALELDSASGKISFFLGVTANDQGNYGEALIHFRKAESLYPRDRRILFQLGRTLLILEQYEEAIEVFKRGLEIDPEAFQLHYQLSLCYEALGDAQMARHEDQLHERFRPRIATPFGVASPEDDNERRPIHEHRSGPTEMFQN